MLERYLKAQVIVLVCGGITGPIFLAAYFFLPSVIGFPFLEPNIRWTFWVGLLITAADVLIALWLASHSAQSAAKTAALEQSGVLALAQITGMSETGMRINDQPVVILNLHIAGPGFAFDAQKRVTVSFTMQGNLTRRKLVVLVDPNTHDYQIDWNRSALVNGLVPAQFSIAEDNRTYDLSGQAGPLMEILQIYKANKIPSSGTVDLREYMASNPAVRQQVLAVIRRAAAQQAPAAQPAPARGGGAAAAPPVVTPPQSSASQRLQELETLRASGAITDAEYNAKRETIISEI
jgi:Short C-terminal domain